MALAVVSLLAERTSLLDQLEGLSVNLRFKLRARFDPPADPRLILVGIDQKSIDRAGAWPWPRNVEADFLKT
ncbi:MAG: CHASE2 domain-containing protein, partial [Pseudolabrys sp.]